MNFICAWFLLTTLSFIRLCLCQGQENITAEPGQNVTLPCRAAEKGTVTVVRLTRDDLRPEYVLVYRNDRIDEELQNPLYTGRTKLQSTTSTNGNVYLTLNAVTEQDAGTYVCRVRSEGNGGKSNTRRKRAISESIIHLDVSAPGSKDGQKGGGGNEDRRPEDGGSKDGAREEGGDEDGLGVGRGRVMFVFAGLSFVVFMGLIVTAVISQKKMKNSKSSPPDDAEKPPLI